MARDRTAARRGIAASRGRATGRLSWSWSIRALERHIILPKMISAATSECRSGRRQRGRAQKSTEKVGHHLPRARAAKRRAPKLPSIRVINHRAAHKPTTKSEEGQKRSIDACMHTQTSRASAGATKAARRQIVRVQSGTEVAEDRSCRSSCASGRARAER